MYPGSQRIDEVIAQVVVLGVQQRAQPVDRAPLQVWKSGLSGTATQGSSIASAIFTDEHPAFGKAA